jgi:glycosyltransferase involved in cell wall biosynthesis
MRISHVSFSRSGGAGAVARRLVAAQQRAGLDSEFIHMIDTDLRNDPLSLPRHTLAAAVDATIIREPGFPAMVSVTRDRINKAPAIRPDRDIVHLHWINGVSRPGNLGLTPSQAVVWTLHDMNPLTGSCHHSLDCTGYTSGCHDCPAVRHRFQNLVTKNFEAKKQSVSSIGDLAIVAPSNWLADVARKSVMFHDHPIHVIPNPVDQKFLTAPVAKDVAQKEIVSMVVAHDLDDPNKNVAQAVEGFSHHHRATGSGHLVLVGRGGRDFHRRPGVTLTGRLGVEDLLSWYDTADHIIVPSEAENAPMVVFEAAARGCWPLVANNSGLTEIPATLGGGNLFTTATELSQLVTTRHQMDTHERHQQRQMLREKVAELCHPGRVEAQYREVYQGQLDPKKR